MKGNVTRFFAPILRNALFFNAFAIDHVLEEALASVSPGKVSLARFQASKSDWPSAPYRVERLAKGRLFQACALEAYDGSSEG